MCVLVTGTQLPARGIAAFRLLRERETPTLSLFLSAFGMGNAAGFRR